MNQNNLQRVFSSRACYVSYAGGAQTKRFLVTGLNKREGSNGQSMIRVVQSPCRCFLRTSGLGTHRRKEGDWGGESYTS